MSALARILAAKGEIVAGSDMADTPTLAALRELGIDARATSCGENLSQATKVVYSAAVDKEKDPEIATARRARIPVLKRSQMLGELMKSYGVKIAIAGTHGKTTTSAMIARMLENAGKDPTALIGGDVRAWGSNARLGKSDVFVAEACEAFESFHDMHPSISVVTNIEADHLDTYANLNKIIDAFRKFLAQTSQTAVLCADDPNCMRLVVGEIKSKVVTYGFSSSADICGIDMRVVEGPPPGSACTVLRRGKSLGEIALNVTGKHNVLNALAAVAVGLETGLTFGEITAGLAAFQGTGRRFEKVGETTSGVLVIDDYAHHPTEIKATLSAARAAYPNRRIVAVFQPHLPSRTRDFMDDFAQAFADAHLVVLTDIYLARERPLKGVTGELLAQKVAQVREADLVHFVENKDDLPDKLKGWAKPGDLVLTLGAGDIDKTGKQFLEMS